MVVIWNYNRNFYTHVGLVGGHAIRIARRTGWENRCNGARTGKGNWTADNVEICQVRARRVISLIHWILELTGTRTHVPTIGITTFLDVKGMIVCHDFPHLEHLLAI